MFTNRFSALLTVALALLQLSPSAYAQDIRTIERIDDADYFGFDLRTEKNVSIDECEASCIGDASCRAFTFNPKVNWCFLKSDYDQLNSFPGAIAGRIVGSGGSLLVPAGLVGGLLVLAADLVGQFALGARYPVGVITGVLGAPYLVVTLARISRSGGTA